jgi:predicted CXXCH cytochrome family protein
LRRNAGIAISIGAAVVVCAGFAAWAAKGGKYIGTAECVTCHKGMHAALIAGYAKTAHHAAMTDATKKPEAIVAVFDNKSPIKKSDIKYVLGLGRSYQNYLDKDLKVLPGEWNSKDRKWVSIPSVDGATQCVGCHVTNFDPAGKTWTELGVGCEACHGPGGEHADSMDAADINSLRKLDPKRKDMVCGQCHAFGVDPTGNYAFPTTFAPGDDLSKSFKLKGPGEGGRNIQYNGFVASKHYEGGMACTTCHDPHGDKSKAAPQLKQPINNLCLACHKATIGDLKSHAPSAPADATCATCHMPKGSHRFTKANK